MKKLRIAITMLLCFALLAACGKIDTEQRANNSASAPLDNLAVDELPNGSDSQNSGAVNAIPIENNFLTPEYDYEANKLNINDLSTGAVTASYSFEYAQTPMLVQKINQGFVMLSSQGAADVQISGGVSIISGDNSADTLTYWLFDKELKLQEQHELTDVELIEGLQGYVFAISPNGQEIMFAIGDCLYCYTIETKKLEQVAADLDESVYYSAIRYSDSGKYLAFFGSLADLEGTAYGSIHLESKTGKVLFADKFSASTLTVNGEYAAIADTILPASMGGPSIAGSVLYLDLANHQGRKISVETGAESGLASVSADGCYVITGKGGDSPSGVLRAYQVSDGVKVAEQTYTMDVNCKPYSILVLGQSAYAVLATQTGNLISPALLLH